MVHVGWYEPPGFFVGGRHGVISSRGVLKNFCIGNLRFQLSISMEEAEIAFLDLEINKYWIQSCTSILYPCHLGDRDTALYKEGVFLFSR